MTEFFFAARRLLKAPGFTLAAVATLGLGIGVNIAIFSLIHAVLLKPLPYPDPDRLVQIRERVKQWESGSVAYPNYLDWRERNSTCTDLSLSRRDSFNVSGGIGMALTPERIPGATVTANFLRVLSLAPLHGRDFRESDDVPGAARVTILGEKLWQSRFGADPAVVGRTITVDGEPREIIGIFPAEVQVPRAAQIFIPLADQRADKNVLNRGNHPGFTVHGRLKAGVTAEQAAANLDVIALDLEKQYPDSNTGRRIVTKPLLEAAVGTYRQSLLLLMAAVGCVLLIACANVANLQLARASGRARELAVRAALGASRRQIALHLLSESLLLALIGAGVGAMLAGWSLGAIRSLSPAGVPRFLDARIDWIALSFTAAVAIGAALLAGLWPTLRFARGGGDISGSLNETGSRGSSDGPAARRVRGALVSAQVALALILLAGAGLTLKSFRRAQDVPLGFDPGNLLTMTIEIPQARYDTPEKTATFYTLLLERVSRLPGVVSAAIGNNIPFDDSEWDSSFHLTGTPPAAPGEEPSAEVNIVSPDYFRLMGMPILRGRGFQPEDSAGKPKSVVIDEFFAQRYFAGVDPIGQQIDDNQTTDENPPAMTVVGVVPRTRNEAPGVGVEAIQIPQIYYASAQIPQRDYTMLVRVASGDPLALAEAVKREVRALDSDQPVALVTTMSANIAASLGARRLTMTLFTAFAGLALLLACVGLYGVMAINVTQRTRELGIRLALGAAERQVFRLVLSQGIVLVGIGLAAGLVVSLAVSRAFSGLLYSVDSLDAATYAAAVGALTLVGLIACWLPARRATRVDPAIALRTE